MGSEYWKRKSTYVLPGERAEIYKTNRDDGVTDNHTYHFTTEVIVKNPKTKDTIRQFPENFALRLKLHGSTIGSHMWQSVRDQANEQHDWHDDRKKWNASMNIGDHQWNVKYWAYFTGGDDNVEYVFQEEYPLPTNVPEKLSDEWNRSHLNILTYNIYMRPRSARGAFRLNGQMIRAKMIPDKIPGYDMIVFQEAFDGGVRTELLDRLKKSYPYQSRVLGSQRGLEWNGGVVTVSKWPLVSQKQQLFKDVCSGNDCGADKGVLYVKINKVSKENENNFFHIFGTHLNAGDWKIQKQQLQIIRNFLDAQQIPQTEPVLFAGDMNIRKDTDEYKEMLAILGADYLPEKQLRGHSYTDDGVINKLNEGSRTYVDYVLYSTSHMKPDESSFAEVRMLRSNDEWKEFPHEKAMWDLSDHFPVYASYHFDAWNPSFYVPLFAGPLL
ncbi:MAG: sphingomyelin phosphodiesterase [Nitrospirales bacterium]|nr:sphingomyelin phosphodiesterase [Nitrospirales bacterium]